MDKETYSVVYNISPSEQMKYLDELKKEAWESIKEERFTSLEENKFSSASLVRSHNFYDREEIISYSFILNGINYSGEIRFDSDWQENQTDVFQAMADKLGKYIANSLIVKLFKDNKYQYKTY